MPITSFGKLCANGHWLYIKAYGNYCIGILKVGTKRLFVNRNTGDMIEMSPLSVLDFYVHESVQRGGHGRDIFNEMMKCERVEASKLAYDRPSLKLKSFLAKYFNLTKYVNQNNNFVVFDDYFEPSKMIKNIK